MTSLRRLLPKPQHPPIAEPVIFQKPIVTLKPVPPYGQRDGWVPRSLEDFGEDGAFAEIWIPQYPLDMGKEKSKTSNALAVPVDALGKVSYEAVLKQGRGRDVCIYSQLADTLPSKILDEDAPALQTPDLHNIQKETEKTRLELEKLTQAKLSPLMPIREATLASPVYIRYTPAPQGRCYTSGASEKIIKMKELSRDPMEPARFKINKKIPALPPSPPAPVCHSPIRKASARDQKAWTVPPCLSHWKNSKGYTIPLAKKLAATGDKCLRPTQLNDNFARVSEALYIAYVKAGENIRARVQVEKKAARKEREEKEQRLRKLAQEARRARHQPYSDEDEEVRKRYQLRYDRRRDRQRERNIARAGPEKRSLLERQQERDISETVALGLPTATTSHEVVFDQRLFNQQKGLTSGFGEEDYYNVYDLPWQQVQQSIYRPVIKKDIYEEMDVSKFASFNCSADERRASGGPVQFKREEEDIFGLSKFLTDAKRANKRSVEDEEDAGLSPPKRQRM